MPKAMLLKVRSRMGATKVHPTPPKKGSVLNEEQKLEAIEERLENVDYNIRGEIDKIEKLKEGTGQKHEFGWIKGKVTTLLLQDFVGASFGAMVFVFTQEVWETTARIGMLSVMAIILISLIAGFSLVYLSRRRKVMSIKVYHTALMRGIEIYVISLLTSFLFIIILGVLDYKPLLLFKGSVLIALPAVISAATADLLYY